MDLLILLHVHSTYHQFQNNYLTNIIDTVAGLSVVPTVIENLFDQGTINSQTIGISFNPTTVPGVEDGGLAFGEVDPSKFTGEINYVPITSTSPASNYWGVDQTITYGNGIEIMALSAGIVDTGTSFSYIPTGEQADVEIDSALTCDFLRCIRSIQGSNWRYRG